MYARQLLEAPGSKKSDSETFGLRTREISLNLVRRYLELIVSEPSEDQTDFSFDNCAECEFEDITWVERSR